MSREAMKLALEALEVSTDWDMNATGKQGQSMKAITVLRRALSEEPDYKVLYEKAAQQYNELAELMAEQPAQQEPVLCINPKVIDPATGKVRNGVGALTYSDEPCAGWSLPLYTSPQARKPLTDEQIAEMMRQTWGCASIAPRHAPAFARAIEAAHGIKEKNNG